MDSLSISTRSRAIRLAFVVTPECWNAHTLESIARASLYVAGGWTSPIVPAQNDAIGEPWLGLLRAHDADYIYVAGQLSETLRRHLLDLLGPCDVTSLPLRDGLVHVTRHHLHGIDLGHLTRKLVRTGHLAAQATISRFVLPHGTLTDQHMFVFWNFGAEDDSLEAAHAFAGLPDCRPFPSSSPAESALDLLSTSPSPREIRRQADVNRLLRPIKRISRRSPSRHLQLVLGSDASSLCYFWNHRILLTYDSASTRGLEYPYQQDPVIVVPRVLIADSPFLNALARYLELHFRDSDSTPITLVTENEQGEELIHLQDELRACSQRIHGSFHSIQFRRSGTIAEQLSSWDFLETPDALRPDFRTVPAVLGRHEELIGPPSPLDRESLDTHLSTDGVQWAVEVDVACSIGAGTNYSPSPNWDFSGRPGFASLVVAGRESRLRVNRSGQTVLALSPRTDKVEIHIPKESHFMQTAIEFRTAPSDFVDGLRRTGLEYTGISVHGAIVRAALDTFGSVRACGQFLEDPAWLHTIRYIIDPRTDEIVSNVEGFLNSRKHLVASATGDQIRDFAEAIVGITGKSRSPRLVRRSEIIRRLTARRNSELRTNGRPYSPSELEEEFDELLSLRMLLPVTHFKCEACKQQSRVSMGNIRMEMPCGHCMAKIPIPSDQIPIGFEVSPILGQLLLTPGALSVVNTACELERHGWGNLLMLIGAEIHRSSELARLTDLDIFYFKRGRLGIAEVKSRISEFEVREVQTMLEVCRLIRPDEALLASDERPSAAHLVEFEKLASRFSPEFKGIGTTLFTQHRSSSGELKLRSWQ